MFKLFACLFFASSIAMAVSTTDDAAVKLASELQKNFGKQGKVFISIGDIIVVPDNLSPSFGDYLTGLLNEAFTNSAVFTVIDQEKTTAVFKKTKVLLNANHDYVVLDKLSKVIHGATQIVPQGYLYGQIKDFDSEIRVTLKLIDAISGSTLAMAALKYPSDAVTDKLLGKPVRTAAPIKTETRNPEPPVPTAVPKSNPIEPQKLVFDNFTVVIKNLFRSSDNMVTLNFLVTNETEGSRQFTINAGQTSLFDDEGSQYPAEGAFLGKVSNSRINNLWADLPPQAPVKGGITFPQVGKKLTEAKALQVFFMDKEFNLKNIPIER